MTFRAGAWVEVKQAEEILDTLNEESSVNGLPFMPEMLQFCGQRFQVYKSAHKTCDTIDSYSIRSMDEAVHLVGLRCDGSAHGGCQAGCLLFWKNSWLRKVDSAGSVSHRSHASLSEQRIKALDAATRQTTSSDEEVRYRCQATELLKATGVVRRRDRWNPLFYVRDLTSGNVSLSAFFVYGFISLINAFTLRWFRRRYPHVQGLAGVKTPDHRTNLQPGEIIRVRSKEEIMATLNSGQRNRGLWFDVEMVPHCGSERRVLRRVEKIVDEKTGQLVQFANPCIILDGVTCSGYLSTSRMFCPRSIYPYWREIWLQRLNPVPPTTQKSGSAP